MLAEIYVEALLVDEELADQVWEAWDQREIDDRVASIAWMLIIERPLSRLALVWWTPLNVRDNA